MPWLPSTCFSVLVYTILFALAVVDIAGVELVDLYEQYFIGVINLVSCQGPFMIDSALNLLTACTGFASANVIQNVKGEQENMNCKKCKAYSQIKAMLWVTLQSYMTVLLFYYSHVNLTCMQISNSHLQ